MEDRRFQPQSIPEILTMYDAREAEITQRLASLALYGPAQTYKAMKKAYARELAQMQMRRNLFARWSESK